MRHRLRLKRHIQMKFGNACHIPPVPGVLSYEEKDAGGECNLKKFLDLSGLPFERESCYPVHGAIQ